MDAMTDTAEAARIMAEDRQRRVELALRAIQATLQEFDCTLQAEPQIQDGRIVAAIRLAAR